MSVTERASATVGGAADSIRSAGAGVARLGFEARATGFRDTVSREAARHDRGQVGGVNLIGVMFAIILAAAIGMVGTKVISEIDSSIDTTSGTVYDNASNSIATGFSNAMGLTDIVFLVLMFVVVIGALFLARRAGNF